MEINVLRKFREQEDPDMGDMNGVSYMALSKDEILKEFEKMCWDIEDLCKIRQIEMIPENLCRLLYFAKQERPDIPSGSGKGKRKQTVDSNNEEPKKQKTLDALMGKIEELEKKMSDKTKNDESTEFERLQRETKEEAAKAGVNVDTLYEKLLLLDNLARKTNNPSKDRISMVVSRFQAHKTKPSFVATLVLKLLSTKEEEAVLDKEQKLLKCFGLGAEGERKMGSLPANAPNTSGMPVLAPPPGAWPWAYFGNAIPNMQPFEQGVMSGAPMMPQPSLGPRPRHRQPFVGKQVCYRCNRAGHFAKDCLANKF